MVILAWVSFWVSMLFSIESKAQQAGEVFGKNRLQYEHFTWSYISSTNFDIYYYTDSATTARLCARMAEDEFARMSDLLGFSPYVKTRIYLYSSRADLKQSNIGLDADNSIIGGRTQFFKSVAEVAFTGDRQSFRKELSKAIAEVMVVDMMYGGSFKEMVQSNYLLTLPDWFLGGAARYASEGWSQEMDNFMRDAFLGKNIRRPSNLMGEEAIMAGHSIWNYIAEKYGKSAISNVLNLTRVLRDEEQSMANSLGINYDRFINDWRNYYQNKATKMEKDLQPLPEDNLVDKGARNGRRYNAIRFSASGKYLAYSFNRQGRYTVRIREIATGREYPVLKGGYRVLNQGIDMQIPQLAWQGDDALHILRSNRGKSEILVRPMRGRNYKIPLPEEYQFSWLTVDNKGLSHVLSGDKDGQSDLFLLRNGVLTNLTNDDADDIQPRFAADGKTLFFASNRLSDSLKLPFDPKKLYPENFNIFSLTVPDRNPKTISMAKRVTNAAVNHSFPIPANNKEGQVFFLSDWQGLDRLQTFNKEGQRITLSDYITDIDQLDVIPEKNMVAITAIADGRHTLYVIENFNLNQPKLSFPTDRIVALEGRTLFKVRKGTSNDYPVEDHLSITPIADIRQANAEVRYLDPDTLGPDDIDIRNYIFESEKNKVSPLKPKETSDPTAKQIIDRIKEKEKEEERSTTYGPFPYRARLSLNEVVSAFIIDPLLGTGINLESNMTDIFENHKIRAGGTMIFDLTSYLAFAEYKYLKRRFDFTVRGDRKNIGLINQEVNHRYTLDKLETTITYPLTNTLNISATGFYGQTRFSELGVGTLISRPDIVVPYVGYRAEMVFDNTVSNGLNMLEGTRAKIKYEVWNGTEQSWRNFENFSADVRHYQPIFREFILAIRGSYGTFSGPARKSYLLGGMDNWIFNRSETTGLLSPEIKEAEGRTDWLFMQYATTLRGFRYNTLAGNSYLLGNFELRLPIVKAFYRGPISNNFMRNLQVAAFYDVGTAWTGGSPFGQENSVNTKVVGGPPNAFTISVTNFYNPFLSGYGFGVRTLFLGYYLKLDVARGVRNYVSQPWEFYATLGFDF